MFHWLMKRLFLLSLTIGIVGFDDPKEGEDSEESDSEDTDSEEEDSEEEEESDEEEGSEEEDSEEEGKKSGKKGKKESSEAAIQFADLSKLPKELQPYAKELQAKFTKKMQIASQKIKYAEAFEELLQLPSFQKWAKSQDFSGNEKPTRNGKQKDDSDDPAFEKFKSYLDERLAPINEHFGRERQRSVEERNKADIADLEKNFPGWKNFEDDAEDIQKQYGGKMPKSHAVALAAFPKLLEALDKSGALDRLMGKKKKSSTERPSPSNRGNDKSAKPASSIDEAFEMALTSQKTRS